MGRFHDMIVLAAVCWIRLFIVGLKYTSGIFYVALLQEFHRPSGVTSWITSLQYFSTSITCAVGGFLVRRFGSRVITMAGGALMFLGMMTSGFAEHIAHEFITFGVIAGFGAGLVYIGSYESVNVSFSTHRNLAFGFGGFISGLGVVIYPPILQWLIDVYSWRGMFWIMSGLYLNIIVVAILLPSRKVKSISISVPREDNPDTMSVVENNINTAGKEDAKVAVNAETGNQGHTCTLAVCYESDKNNTLQCSVAQLVKYGDGHKTLSLLSYKPIETVKQVPLKLGVENLGFDYSSENTKNNVSVEDEIAKECSVMKIPTFYATAQEIGKDVTKPDESSVRKYTVQQSAPTQKWYKRISIPWHSELVNPKGFYLFVLSGAISLFGGSIITGHLSAHMLSNYHTDSFTASMSYTAFGVSAALGKLLHGALATKNRFNPVLLYVVFGVIGGVGSLVFVFDISIVVLYVYVVVFSLCYASRGGALLPAIIIRLAGEDNFAIGLGVYTLVTSVGFLIGAPVAGWMYDYSHSYMWSFVMAAIAVTSSSLIMLFPCGWRSLQK